MIKCEIFVGKRSQIEKRINELLLKHNQIEIISVTQSESVMEDNPEYWTITITIFYKIDSKLSAALSNKENQQ